MGLRDVLTEFERKLRTLGLHEALRFLNGRTPHRYTAIYRYDGEVLRNLHLVDALAPEIRRGSDVPLGDSYCAHVGETKASVMFDDARNNVRVTPRPNSPVVSYCGVLLTDAAGQPFGSLCHFDTMRCETPNHDIPLLEAAAPLVFAALAAT